MTRSVFAKGVYFIAFLLLCTTVILLLLIIQMASNSNLVFYIPLFAVALFAWVWIGFGELRNKTSSISIDHHTISQKKFLGFGKTSVYGFKEFDGFTTSVLTTENGTHECLYLKTGTEKRIKLAPYYYRNYEELKELIRKNLKYLGSEPFKLRDEIREIFK